MKKKYFYIISIAIFVFANGFTKAQNLYDLNNITQIQITFNVSNWDQILNTYYANGLEERLVGTCIINGVQFDSVGIRYKGESTYDPSNAKNPLNIKLDHVLNQNYQDFETLKLSNGKKDPSFVREVLSYEIARKYMVAPLSNYAQVYINGNYYGLFSSDESINGDFGERYLYADGDNCRIKADPLSHFTGNGSSLEYLGQDSASYLDFYELKSDYGWQDFINLTYVLEYDSSNIENVLDMDRALWMMAFNNILVNLDSYSGPFRQNYYLTKADNGHFIPILWDLNESLGGFEMINSGGSPTSNTDLIQLDPLLRQGDTTWPLLNLILSDSTYLKMYIAHCRTILNENFANGWYTTRANTLQSLINSAVSSDTNAFYTISEFSSNINNTVGTGPDATIGITELIDSRVTFLQNHALFTHTTPNISNISSPLSTNPGSTFSVTCLVSNANKIIIGYRDSPGNVFTKSQMFDDGNHGDGNAGDGVYGAYLNAGGASIQYYIYAENSNAGMFSPERAEYEYYTIAVISDIAINEFMASNDTTVADQDGEYDDWIELYNNTSSTISLYGYYLSDDSTDYTQWAFPDTSIGPGEYLIIWADDDVSQAGLHANFKLSGSGEAIYLIDSTQSIVDMVVYTTQVTDVSTGRCPNGTGSFAVMNTVTYAAMNNCIPIIVNSDIKINEFMASNDTTVADQDGEYDDWIELYNTGTSTISLYGYYLSDDSTDYTQWAFPDTSIGPGEYLIIWADDDVSQTGLHANFKLSGSGEAIYLVNNAQNIADMYIYPGQATDISTGRCPNGTGNFIVMDSVTFASKNYCNSVGIQNSSKKTLSLKIYPNPANENVTVELSDNTQSELYIYDFSGRIMYENQINNKITINVKNWNSGIYLIRIGDKEIKKLIIYK